MFVKIMHHFYFPFTYSSCFSRNVEKALIEQKRVDDEDSTLVGGFQLDPGGVRWFNTRVELIQYWKRVEEDRCLKKSSEDEDL